ncbi:hypothetical protein GCM10010124_12070 [Pilimelia terevasa]|uniref:Uncharacterized protein n=1 Tax=Pilimelia terevasa TaxID=53372 RepID=A0A8J3BI27_9ACTN|nr:hypothetical protein [Pilimelia terevasa]GGK21154.1 hypothetical protein GCM10010124_12070 [Pilimelia terevasa]
MGDGTDQVATLADQLRLLSAQRPELAQQLLADLLQAVDRTTGGALSERLDAGVLQGLGLATT